MRTTISELAILTFNKDEKTTSLRQLTATLKDDTASLLR